MMGFKRFLPVHANLLLKFYELCESVIKNELTQPLEHHNLIFHATGLLISNFSKFDSRVVKLNLAFYCINCRLYTL